MITVVLVEDNLDLAELERHCLEGKAEVRLITHDFERTLRPETWQGVDAVACDLMLPHVAGEDICRYLMHEHPHIRRVICTAKPAYMIPDLAQIAHAVLQKPFSPDAFVTAVLGS